MKSLTNDQPDGNINLTFLAVKFECVVVEESDEHQHVCDL
jgi:hypothetical protein